MTPLSSGWAAFVTDKAHPPPARPPPAARGLVDELRDKARFPCDGAGFVEWARTPRLAVRWPMAADQAAHGMHATSLSSRLQVGGRLPLLGETGIQGCATEVFWEEREDDSHSSG